MTGETPMPRARGMERRRVALHNLAPIRQVVRGRFFVRLYYLADSDSFTLSWNLPGGINNVGDSGLRDYVNPDEAAASYRYCADEIARESEV